MTLAVRESKQDLERLEGIIQKNIGAFYEVGRALAEIRDKGYYCDVLGFETFEAYCKAKWDMSRSYAYRLMDSSAVVDTVSPIGDIRPATESQTRPLARLEPQQQREAWQQAVETAPEGKVTAAHVAKVVKEMTGDGPGTPVPETEGGAQDSPSLQHLKWKWKMTSKRDQARFLKWIEGGCK